jgi:LPXTG-motif cell wall-anchored protein
MSGFFSKLLGKEKAKKKAKQAQKKMTTTIKAAAAVQAAATEVAAKLGLQAQEVHEAGELAKTKTESVIKWGMVAGGIALAAGVAVFILIRRRKNKGRK